MDENVQRNKEQTSEINSLKKSKKVETVITKEQGSELLESVMSTTGKVLICISEASVDCIEQSFANVSYASGKNFKYILLATASYVPLSVIPPLFGYVSCIAWQDAIIAFLVVLVLFSINEINEFVIAGTIQKIKEVSDKVVKEVKTRNGNN